MSASEHDNFGKSSSQILAESLRANEEFIVSRFALGYEVSNYTPPPLTDEQRRKLKRSRRIARVRGYFSILWKAIRGVDLEESDGERY